MNATSLKIRNSDLRLCWHTNSGFTRAAGVPARRRSSTAARRLHLLHLPACLNTFSFAVKGRKLSVSVKTSGAVSGATPPRR